MKTRSSAAAKGAASTKKKPQDRVSSSPAYPFSEIVGQEEMKLALILNVIDPSIGGVLLMGHRGTGKSTAVRALATLLPEIEVVPGCQYRCDPDNAKLLCAQCKEALVSGGKLGRQRSHVTVAELPLGATEDRVCGTLDIERTLNEGIKSFEPGLLARANRGFLYIDEVNLLEDHLVDLLLDVAATGVNTIERESISIQHPARFVLIGSGNPEEGELRPQLLDRFGVFVEIRTENELETRVKIVERRESFDRDPATFNAAASTAELQLKRRITRARRNFHEVNVPRDLLRQTAQLCAELSVDGHRGELTITRAARALAAFEGHRSASENNVRRVAIMSLRHRLRRDALEEMAGGVRVEQALAKVFHKAQEKRRGGSGSGNRGESDRPAVIKRDGELKGAVSARPLGESPMGESPGSTTLALPASAFEQETPKVELDEPMSLTRWPSKSAQRGKGRKRISENHQSGRYKKAVSFRKAGSKIALDATLRATAGVTCQVWGTGKIANQHSAPGTRHLFGRHPALGTAHLSLRFKRFTRKSGKVFIFAIDASGSMALNRINGARRVLLGLLKQSYINRDRVAVVAFRGNGAEILLPPSRSMLRARRALDLLRVGGGTPLSAGLACSLELAKQVCALSASEVVLMLFTDGHANVPLGENVTGDRVERWQVIQAQVKSFGNQLRKLGVSTVVVETQNGFVSTGEARLLAKHLGAGHVRIGSLVSKPGVFDSLR